MKANIAKSNHILKETPEKQKITFHNAAGIGIEKLQFIKAVRASISQLIEEKDPKYPNTVLVKVKDLESMISLLLLSENDLSEVFNKLKDLGPAIDYWKKEWELSNIQLMKILESNLKKGVAA